MFFVILDSFLRRLKQCRRSLSLKDPVLIGISLEEQILDSVPMDETDM
jgi:5-formyltetrahydrofolate cyclo-ligase